MPESQNLDPILAALSYEVTEMLRLFREGKSFKDIAQQFGRDERRVSRALLDVDAAFYASQNLHVLEREPGRRTYQLTPTGVALVDGLVRVAETTRGAIDSAAAFAKRVPVLCTSNCLGYLRDLIGKLPSNRSYRVIPDPRRSAEIDLRQPLGDHRTRISLLSTLMRSAQDPQVGRITQWNDEIEVLPLSIDKLRLLTVDDLRLDRNPDEITVHEVVLDARATFLTPNGGASWDFLNRSFPEWRQLRPFQHIEIPDLDYGLKCLAGRLVPNAVMIVHGITDETLKRYGLEDARFHDFAVHGPDHLQAVTGVYHRHSHTDADATDPSSLIWRTAQQLWSEKERNL
ncbi:hypothetical protein ABT297_29565 [Dactylosporangium sp. NPDC000555]|uniref:hypothetical protein n=1 Tax=Dactylosporangium sp. NPDC000555 TaxID=3154260 RepID=UPI00332EBA93